LEYFLNVKILLSRENGRGKIVEEAMMPGFQRISKM
jgi:hypothetical protein